MLFLIASCLIPQNQNESASDWFFGNFSLDVRFFALFLTGSCIYIFRDIIQYKWGYALSSFLAMLALLNSKTLVTAGVALFGGIQFSGSHFKALAERLSRVLNSTDLSYGFLSICVSRRKSDCALSSFRFCLESLSVHDRDFSRRSLLELDCDRKAGTQPEAVPYPRSWIPSNEKTHPRGLNLCSSLDASSET